MLHYFVRAAFDVVVARTRSPAAIVVASIGSNMLFSFFVTRVLISR
jgi:hypothetical protein